MKHNKKTKIKIGIASRKRWENPKYKKNMSDKLKGIKPSKKCKKEISETLKRKYKSGEIIHPMLGKKHTKEARKLIKKARSKQIMKVGYSWSAEAKKERSRTSKKVWKNKEYRKKMSIIGSKARKKLWKNKEYREKIIKNLYAALKKKPNKVEMRLFNMINILFPKQYKLNVKGGLVLDGFIPDIININGYKKCIELYGDYWHNLDSYKERDKRRLKSYTKLGWDCLIVWEHELDNVVKLTKKIKEFCK